MLVIRDEVRRSRPANLDQILSSLHRKERVSLVYDLLHTRTQPVPWSSWVWSPLNLLKASFLCWVLCKGRLKTKAWLGKYLPDLDLVCVLCNVGLETEDQFFFQCPFSREVIKEILARLDLSCASFDMHYWSECFAKARYQKSLVFRLRATAYSLCVYGIWYARNKRLYASEILSAHDCYRWVVQIVYR